jgi:hypothetical protein
MLSSNFAIFGALLSFAGTISYVIDTLKGKTKPNRVSWLMWAAAPLIAFAAELTQGVGVQSLFTFVSGFGPLLVLAASFVRRKSYWKLTKFDFICGILSALALTLWAITGKGDVAILFSILADLFAATPTIVKSYKAPQTENAVAFFAGAIGGAIVLLTIKNWTFANYGFPLYILLVCCFISGTIWTPSTIFHRAQCS